MQTVLLARGLRCVWRAARPLRARLKRRSSIPPCCRPSLGHTRCIAARCGSASARSRPTGYAARTAAGSATCPKIVDIFPSLSCWRISSAEHRGVDLHQPCSVAPLAVFRDVSGLAAARTARQPAVVRRQRCWRSAAPCGQSPTVPAARRAARGLATIIVRELIAAPAALPATKAYHDPGRASLQMGARVRAPRARARPRPASSMTGPSATSRKTIRRRFSRCRRGRVRFSRYFSLSLRDRVGVRGVRGARSRAQAERPSPCPLPGG